MSHQSDLIATDIEAYLNQHENKELLRFLTCGSVDDGKSTLIGRLLYDSKMIYEDQLAAIQRDSKRVGTTGEEPDLALLVDGLQAEREQGITIDVAYRYFSTAKRKFIIADTPGHEQYTRNMATGASTCELAIILIDARHGVQVQTRRHSFIVSLLGIRHVIIAVNKMDLVDYSEERYNEICEEYREFAKTLDIPDVRFVPMSALKGDNIVNKSEHTPWYDGQPLLNLLETIEIAHPFYPEELRFPVQYVNRPNLNFRGYCGTLTSGMVRPGDEITVLPSGLSSKVKSIVTFDGELQEAFPPMSVTLTLEDEIDVSRGDLIVRKGHEVKPTRRFDANLIWMHQDALVPGRTYDIKLSSAQTAGSITAIRHRINVNTLEHTPASTLELNEIARVEVSVERELIADDYKKYGETGAFIVIDRMTNATVAAGMVVTDNDSDDQDAIYTSAQISTEDRASRVGQKPAVISLNDNLAERDTVLFTLEKRLFDKGRLPIISDDADQAQLLKQAGFIVLTTTATEADLAINDNSLKTPELIEKVISELRDREII